MSRAASVLVALTFVVVVAADGWWCADGCCGAGQWRTAPSATTCPLCGHAIDPGATPDAPTAPTAMKPLLLPVPSAAPLAVPRTLDHPPRSV